jgi:hypothetical protein
MSNLNSKQIHCILESHCYDVIDSMDMDDLVSYALHQMMQSFDKNPGVGDTDVNELIEDIWVFKGEDEKETIQFLVDNGLGVDAAKQLYYEHATNI